MSYLVEDTAPAARSVTWDEVAADRRLGDSVDLQAHVETALVPAAEQLVRNLTAHQLIDATWLLRMADFPCSDRIVLPLRPLQSVTWVKYYDTAGVQQTLTVGTHYRVIAPAGDAPLKGWVELIDGQSWPTVALRSDAVEVKFVAGHGDEPEDVPAGLRAAVRAQVAKLLDPHDPSVPDPMLLAGLYGVDV